MLAFVLLVLRSPERRVRLGYGAVLITGLLIFCAGCGGHSKIVDNGTPKGSYTITVTATSGQTTHTSTITVVVGP